MVHDLAPPISSPHPLPGTPSFFSSAGRSDRGRRRLVNQDRFGIFFDIGLFAVADGMGGKAEGEVAAQIALDVMHESLIDPDVTWPRVDPDPNASGRMHLADAIQRANHEIFEYAGGSARRRGMGTTVAALYAHRGRAFIAHVGDSRVYRLRAGLLECLTEDHSLLRDYVRAGLVDPDRADAFVHKNVITRALGPMRTVKVDVAPIHVLPGDTFLLCSDGLHNMVRADEMAAVLSSRPDLDEATEELVNRANEAGGRDNITAVLVRWDGRPLAQSSAS